MKPGGAALDFASIPRIRRFARPGSSGFRIPEVIAALAAAMFVLAGFGAVSAGEPASRPPNMVVILADDQGWGDLSLHGNPNLSTPNLDSLAREGASFERFYVSPVCSPTRAEFLTGRWHPRTGVRDVSRGGERLNLNERTLAEVFKAAGHSTGVFGKWHLGTQYPYHPNGRGFDEFYGFASGHWGDYFSPPLEHNGRPVRGKGYLADDIADRAVEFIAARRDRPFFLHLAFNTPHSPMQVPDADWERFKNRPVQNQVPGEKEAMTRAALAMVENLDWNTGKVLAKLKELDLERDTIVVFFSDNGPMAARWNGGMKGLKGTADEGGIRAPLFIRWPGRIRAGTVLRDLAAAIDLAPTLAALAGLDPKWPNPPDGRNLAPRLLGEGEEDKERIIFSAWGGKASARSDRHRLDAAGALHDMIEDPGQARDVAAERPAEAARLREALAAWRTEVPPKPGKDDRPFTAGWRDFPRTVLPARDGVASGGIQRSGRAPNCSYFTNWTSLEGEMTWDVEIREAGLYEAEILYACPASSAGSRIELSLGGARVEASVTEPNDVPARGAENDRVPRGSESLVKDFKPMALGAIRLESGRGFLRLRALEMKGPEVAEIRAVILTLKP